jgi:hypothetical protein
MIRETNPPARVPRRRCTSVDPASLYWTDVNAGAVWRAPIVGAGAPTQLASGFSQPRAITLDTNNVYVVENTPVSNGKLLQTSRTTGMTKVLISDLRGASGIAVDDKWIYFAAGDNTLRRILKQ